MKTIFFSLALLAAFSFAHKGGIGKMEIPTYKKTKESAEARCKQILERGEAKDCDVYYEDGEYHVIKNRISSCEKREDCEVINGKPYKKPHGKKRNRR